MPKLVRSAAGLVPLPPAPPAPAPPAAPGETGNPVGWPPGVPWPPAPVPSPAPTPAPPPPSTPPVSSAYSTCMANSTYDTSDPRAVNTVSSSCSEARRVLSVRQQRMSEIVDIGTGWSINFYVRYADGEVDHRYKY